MPSPTPSRCLPPTSCSTSCSNSRPSRTPHCLQGELAKVTELREEYRTLVEELEAAETERRTRRSLRCEYDEVVRDEADLKAAAAEAETTAAAAKQEARTAAEEEARLTEAKEALEEQAGAVRSYAGSLEWYEALTGMIGGLGGLSIATGGVQAHTITFTMAAPLPEEKETAHNCRHNVKVSFNRDHTAVRKVEAKSWSKQEVPHNDLAAHAVQSNDWQGFLREYRFRCLNVALTEREVAMAPEVLLNNEVLYTASSPPS